MKTIQPKGHYNIPKLLWLGLLAAFLVTCNFSPATPTSATAAARQALPEAGQESSFIASAPSGGKQTQANLDAVPLPPVDWSDAPACENPDSCARMLVTRDSSNPVEILWSEKGVQTVAPMLQSGLPGESLERGLVKDTGLVAPDGEKVAFTSLKMDSGGPVFLLDLKSGTWTNLVRAMNENLPKDQPLLAEDLWWEIAGWLPDSQGLALAPADLSSVYVVDLQNYSFQVYPFNGGGAGGGSNVQLSPDGSFFVYFGVDSTGGQTLNRVDLSTGAVSRLANFTPEQGILRYPRFAPDGSALAYLAQLGHPLTGLTYSINLFTFSNGSERVLLKGNLGPSVPTWSPDGQYIAFTKKEPDEPDLYIPDQAPHPMRGNIWVISVAGGSLSQLTLLDGWARNPAWDDDAKTLAFVTQDGEVGMVSLDHPGRPWLAAKAAGGNPLVTSALFIP